MDMILFIFLFTFVSLFLLIVVYAIMRSFKVVLILISFICILSIIVSFLMYFYGNYSRSYISPYNYVLKLDKLPPLDKSEYIKSIWEDELNMAIKEGNTSSAVLHEISQKYKQLCSQAMSMLLQYKTSVETAIRMAWKNNDLSLLAEYNFTPSVIEYLEYVNEIELIVNSNIDHFLSINEEVKSTIDIDSSAFLFRINVDDSKETLFDIMIILSIYALFLNNHRELALETLKKEKTTVCDKLPSSVVNTTPSSQPTSLLYQSPSSYR